MSQPYRKHPRRFRRTRSEGVPGPLQIIEEAVGLVRTSPPRVLLTYYIGAAPFVLGLLFFWSDMSRGAYAYERCAGAALGMAVLFVWMKCWQAVFAQQLWARAAGDASAPWTVRRVLRLIQVQTVVQPVGLFALPVAVLAMFPFCWVYAFYQNVSVLGGGGEESVREVTSRAWAEAGRWWRQNHIVVWLISPMLLVLAAALFLVLMPAARAITPDWSMTFLYVYAVLFAFVLLPLSPLGVVLAVNLLIAMITVPELLRMFFGIQTVFTRGGFGPGNTTLMAAMVALTYLCMDPVVKAVYVLRCFHGMSVRSGEDLRVALRRVVSRAALGAAVIVMATLGASPALAAEPVEGSAAAQEAGQPVVASSELDQAISEVIQQVEYTWRSERVPEPAGEGSDSLLVRFLRRVAETLEELFGWVGRLMRRLSEWFGRDGLDWGSGGGSWAGAPRALTTVLLLLVAGLLAVLLVQSWRRRRREQTIAAVEVVPRAVDLEDEGLAATELPEDEWLALALELAGQGAWRLAMRALFLGTLANLSHRELVRIARFKSNRDYERELRRRAHAEPTVIDSFGESVVQFERIWYGTHPATDDLFRAFSEHQERIRAGVGST
jgi:Domain of unknown function (DUF4129)